MGRNAKTEYPRTEMIKVRASAEHVNLMCNIQQAMQPAVVSEADVISWALEEYASRHYKQVIKFIPRTQPRTAHVKKGKEIIIGKDY